MLTTALSLVLTNGQPIEDRLLQAALEGSRGECHAMGGTELRYDPGLVTFVNILGDGTADDRILSEASAFCGPDLGPLYAGSAGGPLHAIIGDRWFPLLPGGWAIAEVPFTGEDGAGPPVRMLLVGSHGSFCDTFGAHPCVTAWTWDGERLVSILDLVP